VNNSSYFSIGFKSEEVWLGNSVDYLVYFILRTFRCPVGTHVNDGKLASRAIKCMFLSYVSESKGYHT